MGIEGKLVRLRAIEEEDLVFLRDLHEDPANSAMVGGWSFPLSMLDQARWYHASIDDPRTHRFIIEHLGTHARLGLTGLWGIDWKDRLATAGIVLESDSSVRRQGFGTDTYMTVMRYAFDELNLHRLESDVIEYNKGSTALLVEKCGWHVEGTRRQSAFRGGQFWDRVYVSILADEYKGLVRQTGYWEK